MLSWSIGLFYLVTSEIFSTGNAIYTVKHGIGVALTSLAVSGNFYEYFIGIGVFIAFVIATRLLLFNYLKKRFTKHTVQEKRSKEETNKLDITKAIERIRPLGRAGIGALQRNIVSIRSRFALPVVLPRKTLKRNIARESSRDSKDYRHLVYVALILVLLYAAYSYHSYIFSLAGYEYEVLISLVATLLRIWLAFAIIFAVALPLGVYLVFISKRSELYLLVFQILASIPATILLPFIAISLRNAPYHNELVAFIVFFLSGIWYMVFSLVSSRSTISQNINEVRRIFGIKGKTAWKDIYVKALLPAMITGAITGIAAEWNASIVAERFTTNAISNGSVITSVNVGLGRLLDVSLESGNITLMILGLINLTIVIIIVNRFFWKKLYNRVLTPYK